MHVISELQCAPLTKAQAKFKTIPLTTKVNNPSVIIVNGNVNNCKIGLITAFKIQNTIVIITNALTSICIPSNSCDIKYKDSPLISNPILNFLTILPLFL